jgi:hypothetical protein
MVFLAVFRAGESCGVRTKTIATLGAIATVYDLERVKGAVRKYDKVIIV